MGAENPVRKVITLAKGKSKAITLPAFAPFEVGDLVICEKTKEGLLIRPLEAYQGGEVKG
jgi:hypothetical protein